MIARIGHDGEIEGFYVDTQQERPIMREPKHYVSKPIGVLAIQWTGGNLAAIQKFVAPSSPYFQPARPATPGSASEVMDEHRKAALRVMVPDPTANTQWPAIGPHYKEEPVPMHGWLVKQDGDQDVQVMTEPAFRAMFTPRPMVTQTTSDGMHKTPAPFQSSEDVKGTHPRLASAQGDREPSATDDGATVDKP